LATLRKDTYFQTVEKRSKLHIHTDVNMSSYIYIGRNGFNPIVFYLTKWKTPFRHSPISECWELWTDNLNYRNKKNKSFDGKVEAFPLTDECRSVSRKSGFSDWTIIRLHLSCTIRAFSSLWWHTKSIEHRACRFWIL